MGGVSPIDNIFTGKHTIHKFLWLMHERILQNISATIEETCGCGVYVVPAQILVCGKLCNYSMLRNFPFGNADRNP